MFDLVGQLRVREGLFSSQTQGEGHAARVVVAVSGGADSMALLHLLMRLRSDWNLDLVVAHLDHNIRPESADDATFVGEMARYWNLPFETTRLACGALTRKGNMEANARNLRYKFLAQVATKRQVDGSPVDVAVAHTANDQAETVLMNLIRGSGVHGLAGMRAVRPLLLQDEPVPGVRVVRPLLDVSRSEIIEYLWEHGIAWREDPSNQDRTLVRNRVRHEILPRLKELNPEVIASLCRTASVMRGEVKRIERYTRQALDATRRGSHGEETADSPMALPPTPGETFRNATSRQVFDLRAFRSLSPADQRESLRTSARALGSPLTELGFDTVERLRRSLCDENRSGGPYSWFADVMLTRTQDAFSLHHRDATPILPDHPHLDGIWRATHPTIELSETGEIVVDRWTLRCKVLNRQHLRQDWADSLGVSPWTRTAQGESRLSSWEAFIDADSVEQLSLTSPRPGQRFEPLGLGGHGKALADYFTDCKVPRFLRAGWPILVDGERVVWVGGHQIAHNVPITPRSRRVFHLFWEPPSR
ncbi:MAG: tRNA lysidine(34) synthetase TilS [Caldilineaceae bacterium SB0675_bin_29]|uniref:tRNA(Ile)-lysidine synthase n=1 Tax=Caldilineaceae bacterium SB0675_bin_29 TaxID=2605266 RepID=A0A6B1GBK7_9CHLR|nr:tRNA lysidine(34) synthetase TilS [Caldilineaceae bacterium SB0675_bin_29]